MIGTTSPLHRPSFAQLEQYPRDEMGCIPNLIFLLFLAKIAFNVDGYFLIIAILMLV